MTSAIHSHGVDVTPFASHGVRKHAFGLAFVVLGCASFVLACSEVVVVEEPRRERMFCGNNSTDEPRVLLSGVTHGVLMGGREDLYLIERDRRVLRINRCTGESMELASSDEPGNLSAMLHGDYVYWVNGSDDGRRRLFRVPASGGNRELITDTIAMLTDIGAVGERIFMRSETYGGGSRKNVVDVFAGDLSSIPIELSDVSNLFHFEAEAFTSSMYWGFEVEAAGAFMSYSSHGLTTSPLTRISLESGEESAVAGTDGAGSCFFTTSMWMHFAATDHSVVAAIRRVPLLGGEFETVVSASDEHTNDVRALISDDVDVCWAQFEGAPRCVWLGASVPVRVLGSDADEVSRSIVLAGDGVYWLRMSRYDAVTADVVGAGR